MGTPIRNMVWTVWAMPWTTPAWITAGNLWMAPGLSAFRLSPDGALVRWSAFSTLLTTRLAKMAPNTAVPNDPPIIRKKVTPEVAVPSSSYGTAFWTATVRTCRIRPSPSPNTTM